MPSFDIVSEIDKQEIDNAINQATKELATRFDFKGSTASITWDAKESKIELKAEDGSRLKSLHEIVIGKLAKRNIDLRNVERKDPAISPLGHATQDFIIKQGLDGDKAKEIVKAIKEQSFKVQSALQERQVRVTGKKKDELQEVIGFLRSRDFEVALGFKNFRD
jgi:cyclic-di-GMP-binding protein